MIAKLREFLRPGLVVDTRLYLAALPLALLASVATFAAGAEFFLSIQYLFANLASFAFVGIVFLFARHWVRPDGKPVLFPILAFGLLLGFSKQLSTAVIVVWMGLEPSVGQALAIRSLTPLIGAWTAVAIAVVSGARMRFENLRSELISERVRRMSIKSQADSSELREFVAEAEKLIANSKQMERSEVSGMIRSIVENKLRPLSHELWDREQRRTPGFSARELTIKALTTKPYRVIWVTALFILGSVQPTLVISGSKWFIPLSIISLPVLFAMLLANWLRKRSDFAKERYVGLLLATSFLGGVGGTILLSLFGISNNPLLTLTSAWWLGTLIVVVGVFAVAIEDSAKQRAELDDIASGELDREATANLRDVTNRELANLLHSKTQNHMLAQAMRVDSGADIEAELKELKRVLDSLSQPSFAEIDIAELKKRWVGLLDIEWKLERDPTVLQLRVIEEAISNAYRHGLATELKVTLSGSKLQIVDNGLGPTSGVAGLGSRLYSSAGSWNLIPLESGGAELEIRLRS